jgi:uncharacterized protein
MSLAAALHELHHILQQVAQIRERIARCPKQLLAAETVFKKLETDVLQIKEINKQAKIACDDKQLQLKQREARMLDLRSKLHQAESNQVYQLVKDQIAADQQANSVLADEILEALEKLEEYQIQIQTANANVVKGREELEKTKQRITLQLQQFETELAGWTAKLTAAEDCLPEDFRIEYNRVVKTRAEESLASVDGDNCSGCCQTLTPQTLNEIHLGKPVLCKSCARLLYLEPNSR